MTLVKTYLGTLIVQVLRGRVLSHSPGDRALGHFILPRHINCSGLERQSFEPFSWGQSFGPFYDETATSQYDSFSLRKAVLKRLFTGDIGEALSLHIHCSGLGETELRVILLGGRALSQYGSFSGRWS